MSLLYPLKLKPIFKEKIWGGHKIKTVLNKDFSPLTNCGELWAVSGVEGDVSEVENGFLQGNNLNEVIEIYMDEFLGDAVFQKFGHEFPVLIKFLNAEDFLSVQVHPDDALAWERHQCSGKTEMWYIIDTEKDSELILGFKEGTDRDVYLEKLNSGKIKDILNHVKIAKEDAFFIPAGKVHAIGKGILLAEIQQTSDITYRIYDWDRVDDKGNKRELHVDQALDAINFSTDKNPYTFYGRLENIASRIVSTPYFNVNNFPVTQPIALDLGTRDSFTVYVCTQGKVDILHYDEAIPLSCGECVIIPAELNDITIKPEGKAVLLEVYLDLSTE
ncbi:MAG: mannose-6-phosphate isomerase [Bacteroidales bacterium]|nr:mannose-6-phosphate isomerase [Bacteroidales bacterium]